MNSTYGLECQVRYLAEQVDRLTRTLNDILPAALKDILTALEKKEEEKK